jgi:hypothetical protein
MRVACRELKCSYQKVRRFCRHYVRAQKDPAVAIKWALGLETRSANEQKTWKYQQDLEKGGLRQSVFRERLISKFISM